MDPMPPDSELKEVQKLEGHEGPVRGLAWIPVVETGGAPSVLASCGSVVRIWEQSRSSRSWSCKEIFEDTTPGVPVRSCVWSHSGQYLTIAWFDEFYRMWLNDGGNYEFERFFLVDEKDFNSVSWNASGLMLAACGSDPSIWLWDFSQPDMPFYDPCENPESLIGHQNDVHMVKWHPTVEKLLFSCSSDNTIKVWWNVYDEEDDVFTVDCVQTLDASNNGHSSTVWALSFNPTGNKMVTCSDDQTLKIWEADIARMESGDDYAPWSHVFTISGYHTGSIFSVDWSREGIIASGAADGSIYLFVESTVNLFNRHPYRLLLKKENAHDGRVNSVEWSPGENRVLASSSDDSTVKIWEIAEDHDGSS